jgi:uncharacterized protein YjbJ (UPF0337 family)
VKRIGTRYPVTKKRQGCLLDLPLTLRPPPIAGVFLRDSSRSVAARKVKLNVLYNCRSRLPRRERLSHNGNPVPNGMALMVSGSGAAKETVGKAIGDAKMQDDGKTDTAVDKIQNAVGSLKDAVKKPATPLASF